MKRNKVLRFCAAMFVAGAVIGLGCGLAFGGGSGTSAAAAGSSGGEVTSTTTSATVVSSNGAMTAEMARAIGANEMGQVLVIMYHLIDDPETEYTRTPANFRSDLALLKAEGYYPINVRDLAAGNIDIPAGKSPVVITFDDSSPGQYRILDNGEIDPDCAVGIMQAAVKAGDWAPHASFFCLLDVTPKERVLFGQPEKQQEKLRNLVDWGYEVGSHTVTHLNLKKASVAEATKQLAQSQQMLEDLIGGGYAVTSIAIPYGEYPADVSIIKSGSYEDIKYTYSAALSVVPKPCASPFSAKFDAFHIPRITATESYVAQAIKNLKDHPELRYISDGDPTTVSAPTELSAELGAIQTDLGRPVVRY